MTRLITRLQTLLLAAAKRPLRRAPAAGPARRVLVAHYLLLGDTLLLAPLLAKIAARYPEAERFVLARPAVAPLFAGQPYGFRALAYNPRDGASVHRLLGAGPFDLAFVLGDNRYSWLARAAGARWIVAFENDSPAWKNWMVDEALPHPARPTAWADMTAGLLAGQSPAAYSAGDWPAPAAADFDAPPAPYAVLHVGASTTLKTWPAERWRALAALLLEQGLTPVWSAGQGEAALIEAIDPEHRHRRYSGTLSLAQLWHLLAGARLLVCPDTGVAHLGKVVGVPTVTLFGPGSPTIYGAGEFWREARYVAVAQDPFPCRDQQRLFRREIDWVRRCGRDQAACVVASAAQATVDAIAPCMHAIPLDAVWHACRNFIPHSSRFPHNPSPQQATL